MQINYSWTNNLQCATMLMLFIRNLPLFFNTSFTMLQTVFQLVYLNFQAACCFNSVVRIFIEMFLRALEHVSCLVCQFLLMTSQVG